MNFNKRIEELNTNLVLKETIIIMLIDDLKDTATKTDEDSNKKFKFLINEIQHNKKTTGNPIDCLSSKITHIEF